MVTLRTKIAPYEILYGCDINAVKLKLLKTHRSLQRILTTTRNTNALANEPVLCKASDDGYVYFHTVQHIASKRKWKQNHIPSDMRVKVCVYKVRYGLLLMMGLNIWQHNRTYVIKQ